MLVIKSVLATLLTCCWIVTIVSHPEPTPAIEFESVSQDITTETPLPTAQLQVSTALRYSIAYVSGSAAKRKWFPVRAQDINASAYTHLIYSFATINENNQLVISDTDESTYLRDLITHVKNNYPAVKVLIAVDGTTTKSKKGFEERYTDQYNTGASPRSVMRLLAKNLCTDILECFRMDASKPHLSRMFNTVDQRIAFIQSALSLLSEFGADGLDLDWEYLNALDLDGYFENADYFVALVSELRAAFPPEYSLSVAVPDGLSTYFAGIKFAEMVGNLDFITSMTFDLHGFWEYTIVNGTSYGQLAAHTDFRDVGLGIDATVAAGVPIEKLILGLAFYGQAYKQADPDQHVIGSPFVDPKTAMPDPGKCTGTHGVLGFNEISDLIVNNQASVRVNTIDLLTNTNILAFGTDQWVSFDNQFTFEKRLMYAYNYGLGGTAVRYLDLDDQEYQLSNAIREMRENLIYPGGH